MSNEEATAGVPFMVTAAMKQELYGRGFTDDEIKELTPQEANNILRRQWTAAQWADYNETIRAGRDALAAAKSKTKKEEKVVPINSIAKLAERAKKVTEGLEVKREAERKADEGLRGLGLDRVEAEAEAKEKRKAKIAAASTAIEAMNQRHSVVNNVGGKVLVLSWVPSPIDESVAIPLFQTFSQFRDRYSNQYVTVEEESKALGAYWLHNRKRETYEGIDLVPNGQRVLSGNRLNLWRGWGVEPKPGDWSLMRRHMEEVLASGDADADQYNIRWSAWTVQNPGKVPEVALVLRGGKGSGKGTFAVAVRRIFGQHGLAISSSKHLVGSFTGHTRNCILLFADEAFWAGDKQGESNLKALITEPTRMVEAKFQDAGPIRNLLHVIMAANAKWVVPASHDERRYAVNDISGKRINDLAYFEALRREMDNGGLGAMLHDLLKMPLGDWHPRQILQNEALRNQKVQSMGPWDQWYCTMLEEGILPSGGFMGKPNRAVSSTLYNSALKRVPKLRYESDTAMGNYLREQDCFKVRVAGTRGWEFPSLAKARARWEATWGKWKWDEPKAEWEAPSLGELLSARADDIKKPGND
jgi:hypothetical protein